MPEQAVMSTGGLEVRSAAADNQNSFVEGYLVTKDAYDMAGKPYDKEQFTEEAIRSVVRQINEAKNDIDTADVKFPKPEKIETTTGNIEHQSSPAFEKLFPKLVDTDTVPAIELEEAEFDGRGAKIKAPIREHALPEDSAEAVKSNIEDGVLTAFSIEFKNAKDKLVEKGGEIIRRIKDVDVTGAGLTSQPKNPSSLMTAAEIRNAMDEETIQELKNQLPDSGVTRTAGVAYTGTSEGDLDESAISNEIFEHHYLFPADTKSESKFPVVDADHNLRRGNVNSAYRFRDEGEGIDEEDVVNKLEKLNEEFEEPPIDFDDEEDEARNNINGESTVTEEQEQEQANPEADESEETKSVADEVDELRSAIEEVRSENEELREAKSELEEENEELRNKLDDVTEDVEKFDEVRNELDDLKEEVKSASPSEEPVSDEDEQRMEETKSEASRLERELDAAASPREYAEENKSVLAEKHGISEEEVMEHV